MWKGVKGEEMRNRVILIVCIMSMLVVCYLQFGREMEIYNSYSVSADNFEMQYLSVVVNRLFISDKKKCVDEIIQQCIDNDFPNMRFSYDYSIPNELEVEVFLSEWNVKYGRPLFSFEYTAEDNLEYQCNILDDADKFSIKIFHSKN